MSQKNSALEKYLDNLLKANYPVLQEALGNAIRPIPETTIKDWCEENLYLPQEMSSNYGKYDMGLTPYIAEICQCLHPLSQYNEIVFVAPAQIGKTQLMINNIFFNVVNAPANMLFGFSNDEQKNNFVQSRLNPFIDANAVIKDKIFSKRKNEKGDTKSKKMFAGGTLYFASGEAPAGWRSNPCRYAFIDEVDAMPLNVGGEGSPVDLARRRTSTYFGRHKIFLCSTPVNGKSKILSEYAKTDMRHYFVPCPHCNHLHEFEWNRMLWDADGTHVKRAWYECPNCGLVIHDEDKHAMMRKGVWISTNQETTDPKKVGFWLNGLYSPWLTWESIVTTYLEAVKSNLESDMISFYNTILAEQYQTESDTPDWQKILNQAQASDWVLGEVPEDCIFLTSGSDVQQDRIETYVMGWGKYGRGKLVDVRIFTCKEGETTKDINAQCYKDWYDQIYKGTWLRRDGLTMRTVCNSMDRNYQTATINAFWEKIGDNKRFITVRGDDHMQTPISTIKIDRPASNQTEKAKSQNKARDKGVYYYYLVGSSYLKHELYHALKTEDNQEHTISGLIQFPKDITEETCKQLCAEVYIEPDEKHKNGRWKKLRDRNEAIDCINYATACFYLMGGYKFSLEEWDKLADKLKSLATKQDNKPVNRNVQRSQIEILNQGISL